MTPTNQARNYLVSFNTPVTTVGEDGFNELTFYNERSQTAAEKITSLYTAQSTFAKNATLSDIFRNGNALFLNSNLGFAESNRDMEQDFGIIPVPKLDENQERYMTSTGNSVSMMCFPITCSDPSTVGTIIDALCMRANEFVVPEYYDKVLKTKSARDDESQEMIDIIREGLSFDFGWVHSTELGLIGTIYENICLGATNLASKYASIESAAKAGLDKVNAAFGKE